MVREDKTTWKANYFTKLTTLLDEYPKCFIVGADNVGSKQMQEIRIALRGQVGSCKTSSRKLCSVSTACISTMRTL